MVKMLIFGKETYVTMNKIKLYVFLFLTILSASCRKKDDPETAGLGSMKITFQNMVGAQQMHIDSLWYLNENGDSLQISEYKYYISNIKIQKNDGTLFIEPESYHLINQKDKSSLSFTIDNLPTGEYNKISFMVGVDEARNTSGAQVGALDPANAMFWDWNSGYIMAKMEGKSPQSTKVSKTFEYHLGGFTGKNNVLQVINLNLPSNAIVTQSKKPNIHLHSDALEWFKTPVTIKIGELSTATTPGATLKMISDNYADMFTVDHID